MSAAAESVVAWGRAASASAVLDGAAAADDREVLSSLVRLGIAMLPDQAENPAADVLVLARDVGLLGFAPRPADAQVLSCLRRYVLKKDVPGADVVALACDVGLLGFNRSENDLAVVSSLVRTGVIDPLPGVIAAAPAPHEVSKLARSARERLSGSTPAPKKPVASASSARPPISASPQLTAPESAPRSPAAASPATKTLPTAPRHQIRTAPRLSSEHEYVVLSIGDQRARDVLATLETNHGPIAADVAGQPYWLSRHIKGAGEVRVFDLPRECDRPSYLRAVRGWRSISGCTSLRSHAAPISTLSLYTFEGPGAAALPVAERERRAPPQLTTAAFALLAKAAAQ